MLLRKDNFKISGTTPLGFLYINVCAQKKKRVILEISIRMETAEFKRSFLNFKTGHITAVLLMLDYIT